MSGRRVRRSLEMTKGAERTKGGHRDEFVIRHCGPFRPFSPFAFGSVESSRLSRRHKLRLHASIRWLAVCESFPNFTHDFVNLKRLQRPLGLRQLRAPFGQDFVLAGFFRLVIGRFNDLLDGQFPVLELHRLFLGSFRFVGRQEPLTASPQRPQVDAQLFDRKQSEVSVVSSTFAEFVIPLLRQGLPDAL